MTVKQSSVRVARIALTASMDAERLAWSEYIVSTPSKRPPLRERWHAAWGEVERARRALAAILDRVA